MASRIGDLSSSSSTKFNWTIENFSKLNSHEGHVSDVFSVGAFKWKVKIYPKGYGEVYDNLTLALMPIDLTKSVQAEFSFAVTSQTDPSNTQKDEEIYEFPGNAMYGRALLKFMRLCELHDPAKGYLVNDSCVIRVEVTCRVLESNPKGDGGVTHSSAETVPEQKPFKIKVERQ